MEELQRQKRNAKPEEFLQMEGLLTLDELTKNFLSLQREAVLQGGTDSQLIGYAPSGAT